MRRLARALAATALTAALVVAVFALVMVAPELRQWARNTLYAPAMAALMGFRREWAGDEPYYVRCNGEPRRVLALLHTWSGDYREPIADGAFEPLTAVADACIAIPNFNGPNGGPRTCGAFDSTARIVRVINAVGRPIGVERADVFGFSGGGHAALLLIARFPQRVRAASLWGSIHDLEAWRAHLEAIGADDLRASLDACVGGPPSPTTRAELAARSPSGALADMDAEIAIHLNHGAADGLVPPAQSQAAAARLRQVCPACAVELAIQPGRGHAFDAVAARGQLGLRALPQ